MNSTSIGGLLERLILSTAIGLTHLALVGIYGPPSPLDPVTNPDALSDLRNLPRELHVLSIILLFAVTGEMYILIGRYLQSLNPFAPRLVELHARTFWRTEPLLIGYSNESLFRMRLAHGLIGLGIGTFASIRGLFWTPLAPIDILQLIVFSLSLSALGVLIATVEQRDWKELLDRLPLQEKA